MANPGVGAKFVSVNLNKSYGQPSHHHHHPPHHSAYGTNRGRPGSHGSGGMVVLSRPRSANKAAGSKLSVPPPLNLPSLRKEHERFDSLGSGGGPAGGGAAGSGARPTSSGVGWTKPTAVALQEKEGGGDHGGADDANDQTLHGVDGVSRGNSVGSSVYMPPSARPGSVGSLPTPAYQSAEKALLLRGEDFPSLQAALPSSSGPSQKSKDGLNQKQRQAVRDELLNEQSDSSHSSLLVDMRPQLQTSRHGGQNENGSESKGLGGDRASEQVRKQDEYFPGPLPLVRLNPRSDWADDERDTSQGFTDRGRDHGYSKTEAYWDRDFDMPRISVLPHKPVHNPTERWGPRDSEAGKVSSSEVPKVDPYGRDVRTPSREGREGNSWRNTTFLKDGNSGQVGNDRSGFSARPSSLNRETSKDNKYSLTSVQENAQDNFVRRDGYRQGGRQPWNNSTDSYTSRGPEWNKCDRYGSEQQSRYRGDAFQSSSASKLSYSVGGKGLPVNDPLLNFGRDKRPFSKSEKPYVDDPFMKDFGGTGFDSREPFSASLFGVVKKKKDVIKQTDFHDPVRESFEAELERVQKMQEQERQQIIEEQERAVELARREEEERTRMAREQEERQRRMEEEARESAWRAEQEQLDAMRRAEEQRLAREEEKRRLFLEEERRKHAAKQKLLELEERIAKRKAETGKTGGNSLADADEKMSRMEKEKDASRAADMGDWEDGERMVERITASASSDSSLNRSFEMGSRSHYSRDSSPFVDRGKPVNSWRRDVYENGNSSSLLLQDLDNGHHSPRRDSSVGGRAPLREEFYGGSGFMSSSTYHKGGISEPLMDDITHLRGQRWNLSGDGDHYSRNMEIESEFHDKLVEKFSDAGWGQGRVHGNPYSPYPEQSYPNSDADGPYSFNRSRYSMRQPRVLPPPSLASMHKTSYRGDINRPGPSAFLDNEIQYDHAARSEPTVQTGYDTNRPENIGQPEIINVKQENTGSEKQKLDSNTTPRCDSQSSLSVSSPPSSPTHLSHDDLDESRDSSVLSAPGDGKEVPLSGQENEPLVLPTNPGQENVMNASSSISTGDDEEWAVENNGHLQEQEEYDEDEDGYGEEDEVHEVDDENIDLTQEFDDVHLEEKGSPDMDNLVLGFNEGVEVGMPNDEFERSSRNEEGTFVVPKVASGTVEGLGPFDGICTDEPTLQPMDGSSQVNVGSSSRMFQETEKAMQNLVIQPSNVSHMSPATERVEHVDASSSSGPSSQLPVTSSVSFTSHLLSSQAVMPTVSSVPNQTEGPVKLQFGLFSGPSLIPSPVPAIQIGSIQMPLPLHPQVGPSLAHLHPSQPLFQFGQLRYTSPISQGVLPMGPQSMSFVQPNLPTGFSLNQSPGGPLPIQTGQGISQNMKNDAMLSLVNDQPGVTSRHLDASQDNVSEKINSMPAGETAETSVMVQRGPAVTHVGDSSSRSESVFQAEDQRHNNSVGKNFGGFFGTRESQGQAQTGAEPSQSVIKDKDFSGPRNHGPTSGGRGRKYVVTVKNSGSRSFPVAEPSHLESSGFHRRPRRNMQRTEFRVRVSADKRQSTGSVSSNHVGLDEKYVSGRGFGPSVRSGPRRVVLSNKPSQLMFGSEGVSPGPRNSQEIDSGSRAERGAGKDASTKSQNVPQSGEGNLKRNIHSEEDVYAPLQSGFVRVFEQPGIEAPSDEDDFIEVRSKRQMLNDRREQREKEIKAKSRASKVPRKPRSTSKSSSASANSGKNYALANGEAGNCSHSDFVALEGRGLNMEVSAGFNTNVVSQLLAPIGTPAVKSDPQADIRSHTIGSLNTSSLPVVSGSVKNLGRGSIVDNKSKVMENVQASLGSWGNSRINQQVMSLTQTQLDEAMKPGQFVSHGSVGEITSSVCESSMPSSSLLTKDNPFSSAANPINSLLAGEKIQFGAVTSPTILPPSSRSISHGIGPPGPSRSDMQLSHNLSAAENDCGLLFEKEKHTAESCVYLEDCESEAEAAASAVAVAVAAISSDEIAGNGLVACSGSVADTKTFGSADIDGITAAGAGDKKLASQSRTKQSPSVSLPADLSVETPAISLMPHLPGGAGDQQFSSHSRAEEALSVSLPADLSVETMPISMWPPLPRPPNSSGQMLPHFPAGPPSHFPFYEMNPMMGGPVFAFGPHDESASTTQAQSQKTSAPVSAPLGTWQQCHSGVDSFYGPPAGFTGPFIGPAGGIPGVQGPPHMVVYNHFAPVGQFGQVGLSFMGTAYIPSGKQPDWKHNPASSTMGEMNNINMVSAQRNPTNMPAPIQHLAPGSPLLPMASPLAMFDVSPFQPSPDMSAQARWPHVPASSLQSVPLSMPMQQQTDVILPSNFSRGPSDQSLPANMFPESRTSTSFDSSRNFPVVTEATSTRFPDELGLADPTSSSSTGASTQNVVTKSSSVSSTVDNAKTDVDQNLGTSASGHNASNTNSQSSMHKSNIPNQHYGHSSYHQRGNASQKNSSGGEWSHRRMGYQGRNQSLGAEKNFPGTKMKQIYVAKQTSIGSSTAS